MYNSPNVLLKGIQARFLRGLATTPVSMLSPVVEQAVSDMNKETYVLFNHFGIIKEWLSEIEFNYLEDFAYEIINKDWQNGFLVDRNTLSDSRKYLGNDVEREINFSLDSWSNFPDRLVTELIINGQTGLAFDGVAMFAASRPKLQMPGTTFSNLLTGSGVTQDNIITDLLAGMVALRQVKARNGDPFNYNPKWTVLIPPQLEWKFKMIRNASDLLSGGQSITNIYKETFDIIVVDYLIPADNDWFLVNTNSPFKPFIYQTRKPPEFDMIDAKDQKFIKYFSTARMNVGYGNPLSIAKINN